MSAPDPQTMKGPGILYVVSKIADTEIMDGKTYLRWYFDDHIAEIVQTSGINSALFLKHIDPLPDKPYLAMYPMADMAFTQGDEFRKIRVHSDMLPNGGPIYDLADIDVRYYSLTDTYDPEKSRHSRVKKLLTAGYTLGPNTTEQEYEDWYQQEHLSLVAKVPGFVRCTRFKLIYYRTNAQSRELKGLPARAEDKVIKEPPTYMNLFEFDIEEPDMAALTATGKTDWARKIIGDCSREVGIYLTMKSFGDEKFFH